MSHAGLLVAANRLDMHTHYCNYPCHKSTQIALSFYFKTRKILFGFLIVTCLFCNRFNWAVTSTAEDSGLSDIFTLIAVIAKLNPMIIHFTGIIHCD